MPFEGPAAVADWAHTHALPTATHRLWLSEPLPEPNPKALLVVLGGPMSVNDEEQHRFLRTEKQHIRQAIDAGQPVLGLCLGAQLIASALGQRVYPARHREIGWWPVHTVSRPPRPSAPDPPAPVLPESFTPLHWHGDTFDLPPDAVHLARTELCPHQAFALVDRPARVLGLQFHLEATPDWIESLIFHCPQDLQPGPCVQTPDQIRVGLAQHATAAHTLLDTLLRWLIKI